MGNIIIGDMMLDCMVSSTSTSDYIKNFLDLHGTKAIHRFYQNDAVKVYMKDWEI